jgi:hypothetical protein
MKRVGLHQLAEERSRAIHALIASRLPAQRALLARAKERVASWRAKGAVAAPYVARWEALLDGPVEALVGILTEKSELANELRQVSPFAGAVDPCTRWRVWEEVRRELGR